MKKGFKSIGSVLESKGRRSGLSRSMGLASIAMAWEEHMRGMFAAGSAVNSITDGVIRVSVDEPVWAQQMSMLGKEILEELGKHCDLSGIKDIRFMSFGSTVRSRPTRTKSRRMQDEWPVTKELNAVSLSGEDLARFERMARHLPKELHKVLELHVKTEAIARLKDSKACPICGIGLPTKSRYCQVCALRKEKARTETAVSFLMESPLSSDADLIEVSGLAGLEEELVLDIVAFARRMAGKRLIGEAVREGPATGADGENKAWPLLVAGVCASTGETYDAVMSQGLENYVPEGILEELGLIGGKKAER